MVSSAAFGSPTVPELEAAVRSRVSRVTEFKFIAEEARRLGVKVYLFGGTAAGFAHYVNWDLRREQGDKRYRPDRFDYDFINIYRSTQDLDIVVDGSPEKAAELQKALVAKYPSFQGSKSQWEVRLLRQDLADKQALLNNPDFMNQHTDSNSTGLIDLTAAKGEPVVRDLRDWDSRHSQFSRDVVESRIHYYFSPNHETTSRARDGLNPAILSVIRLLTKAYQYELEIRPEDEAKVRDVIQRFDPQAKLSSYVSSWLEKNAPKLVRHAVNIEFAMNELDRLGLRSKLIAINGNANTQDSMAWWLSREPLKSSVVGQGSGKTASELGIKIVAHETNSFLSYESITRSHTNEPNVLVSRASAVGEAAAFGEGFYTGVGRKGRRGTGWTIRFQVDPRAREGTDFFLAVEGDFVVFTNKKALRVIQEDMNVTVPQYFRLLETIDASDRGVLEKIRRRLADAMKSPTAKEIAAIKRTILALPGEASDKSGALAGWLQEPMALQNLDLLESLIRKGKFTKQIFNDFLKHHPRETRPLIELAMKLRAVNVNEGLLAILEFPAAWNEADLRERVRAAVRNYPDHNLTNRYFSLARYPEDASFLTEFTKYDGPNKLMFQRTIQAMLDNPGWGQSKDFMTWIRFTYTYSTIDAFVHLAQSADLSTENARAFARYIESTLPTNNNYFTALVKPLTEAYEALDKRFTLAKSLSAVEADHVSKVVTMLEKGANGAIANQALLYLREKNALTPAILAATIRAAPEASDLRLLVTELSEKGQANEVNIATAIIERYVSLEPQEQAKLSPYGDSEGEIDKALKFSANREANASARISLMAFKRTNSDQPEPTNLDEATRLKIFERRMEAGLQPGSQFDVRLYQMKWERIVDGPEGRFLIDGEEKILLEKILKFAKFPRSKDHKRYALEMMIEVMTATRLARDPQVRLQLRRALGTPETDWGHSSSTYLDALEDLSKIDHAKMRNMIYGHSLAVAFLTNLSVVHKKSFAQLSEGLAGFAMEANFMRAIVSSPKFDPTDHRLLETLAAKNAAELKKDWLPKQAQGLKEALASYNRRFAAEIASLSTKAQRSSQNTQSRSNAPLKRTCEAIFH